MLIRCKGYNSGVQEYLEEGAKAGREFTRDELDERVILIGDLDLTRMVYESIPDKGQDRYLSYTLAFREDNVSYDTLLDVTTEFKQFLMHAYKSDEFNFYAEAHVPKIKLVKDNATGEMTERKPHIHIIIPRKNMLSGLEANPAGMHASNVKYLEAFQEYINQKYNLASPREHIRIDPKDAASVLSRYKGDDFYGKNREFKQDLVKQVIAGGIATREDFYALVATHGETRVRNEGKPNEYIAVKLPDDAKFTNLKDTIFQDDFIVRRELKKPPLDKKIIQERLLEWPQRAKEIKYVSKATPSFRQLYKQSSATEKAQLLIEREQAFYQAHGEPYDSELHTIERKGNHQRSADETGSKRSAEAASGLQDLPVSDVATHRQTGSPGQSDSAVLLPSNALLHLGQPEPGGDTGLRPSVRAGRGGRSDPTGRRSERRAGVSEAAADTRKGTCRRGVRARAGDVIPPYARNPHSVATIADIEARGQRLFDPLKRPADSELVITLATAVDPGGGEPSAPSRVGAAPEATTSQRQRKFRNNTSTARNIPPYALNPHRVATIFDVEKYSQRLFAPLKRPVDSELVMKLATLKPVAVNRRASTVAAYFNRQIEQNQLLPAQRKAVQRVNKQFFELRRSISSDDRLTKQDKAQLVSVLTFERMKAHESIHFPLLNKEATYMGSAEIRGLINNEPQEDNPEFSISGPGASEPAPVRERIVRLIKNMALQLDEKTSKEREQELGTKDIYTRKARFSQNVHYLSKTTDKTLFVDTGTSIAMRRTGITEAGVGVALQLATQRFGSTLTVNGTAEFKRLVVEAAAKGGIDVHFTDKVMNAQLAERRVALEIERDGNKIEQSTPAPEQHTAAHAGPTQFMRNGQLVDVDPADVVAVSVLAKQLDAEVAQRSSGIESSNQEIAHLEQEIASLPRDDEGTVRGVLLNHGAAPYQNDPKNKPSYFVELDTGSGSRIVWGIGLAQAMDKAQVEVGKPIRMQDLGAVPVTVHQTREDGSTESIQTHRRDWDARSAEGPTVDELASQLATARITRDEHVSAKTEAEQSLARLTTAAASASRGVNAQTEVDTRKPVDLDVGPGAVNGDHVDRQQHGYGVSPGQVQPAVEESSFIVEQHTNNLARLGGVAIDLLMESPVVARDFAGYHAAQIVAGNDTTQAGKALVVDLMQYENYREAFKECAAKFYAETPVHFKEQAAEGAKVAVDLIVTAEERYGLVEVAVTEVSDAVTQYKDELETRPPVRTLPPLIQTAIDRLIGLNVSDLSAEDYHEIDLLHDQVVALKDLAGGAVRGGAEDPVEQVKGDAAADRLAKRHLSAFADFEGGQGELEMAHVINEGMDSHPRYKATILEECPERYESIFVAAGIILDRSIAEKEDRKGFDQVLMDEPLVVEQSIEPVVIKPVSTIELEEDHGLEMN